MPREVSNARPAHPVRFVLGSSERKKGAPGPREGQKSTFCSRQSEFCELTFCPQYADLGILRGSSSCRFGNYHRIQILNT